MIVNGLFIHAWDLLGGFLGGYYNNKEVIKERRISSKWAFFCYKIKIEIKATTATALKKGLKYSPVSEGNICIAEPNLEVLTLR